MASSELSGIGIDLVSGGFEVSASESQPDSWSLGCEITLEDVDTTLQETRVCDVSISGVVSNESFPVDIDYDESNSINLDVNVVVDGISSSLVEAQIVPYDDILNINDLSPESTAETRFASSARSAKIIYDLICALDRRVGGLEVNSDVLPDWFDTILIRIENIEKIASLFKIDEEGNIYTEENFYSTQQISSGGRTDGEGEEEPSGFIIDSEMSDTSDNPVANKVIKSYVDASVNTLGEDIKSNPSSYVKIKTVNGLSLYGEGNITIEGGGGGEGGENLNAINVNGESYQPIEGIVTLPDYPSKVSDLINDSGFVNEGYVSGVVEGLVTDEEMTAIKGRLAEIESWFVKDGDYLTTAFHLVSEKQVSSGGIGGSEGDEGLSGLMLLEDWANYDSTLPQALGAGLGVELKDSITALGVDLGDRLGVLETLSSTFATITYVDNADLAIKNRLAAIESWFTLSEDGETLTTVKNLVSEKQVSSGGIGEEGSGDVGFIIDFDMSDTSDNPVANRIIKAYVDSSVSRLANDIVGNPSSYVKLKTINGLSIYGDGNITIESGGGGTGNLTAINVNSESYQPDGNGVVTLPDYPTKVSQLENDKGYVNSDEVTEIVSDYLVQEDYSSLLARLAEVESWFTKDGDILMTSFHLASEREVSAGGVGEEGSGSGSGVILLEEWSNYDEILAQALGANLGVELNNRLTALENISNTYATLVYVDNIASDLNNYISTVKRSVEDNADSIEALRNADIAFDERVTAIESWFTLSEDGETLVTEKNLVSTKQVSSGGIAEEGSGGGDGSGSISGASDASISNQQEGDIIVWQESTEKWVNKRGMYHHVQSTPLRVWEIQHNMGKFPNVKIVDSSKQLCMADIYYVDENNVKIEFGSTQSGSAYLD